MTELTFDEIKSHFRNGNMVKSLLDGKSYKYCGSFHLVGKGKDAEAIDTIDHNLVLYKNFQLAEIMEQGINPDEQFMKHIDNVLATKKRLGITSNWDLLAMDYKKELSQTIKEGKNDNI